MLLSKLQKNYKEIQSVLKTALDAMSKVILSPQMMRDNPKKMQLKLSDFVEEKYRGALQQRLEMILADIGLCVVPITIDDIVVVDNKLSGYLASIGEAASYRLLLQNLYFSASASPIDPIFYPEQFDFSDAEQQDIIDILSAVIRASENGESYVICQDIDKSPNKKENLINAVCDVFFLKQEKIIPDSYKIYGWAEEA